MWRVNAKAVNVATCECFTLRHEQNLQDLNELVLDEGRRPYATLQGMESSTDLIRAAPTGLV